MSAEDKEKFPYDIVKMALPPEAQLAADAEVRSRRLINIIHHSSFQEQFRRYFVCVHVWKQVLGEHDDTPTTDDLVEASANQELDKSPSAALRVQEAILKELTNEDVHKVQTRTTTTDLQYRSLQVNGTWKYTCVAFPGNLL